jgi:hypothetical protein
MGQARVAARHGSAAARGLYCVSILRHDDHRRDDARYERVDVTVGECVALSDCCRAVDLDVTGAADDDRLER